MGHLTIRPNIKIGESLSSYLMRSCHANMIDYLDLINHVQPIKSADFLYKRPNRIDIMPQQKNDMKRLGILLGQTEMALYEMTFNTLRENLNSSDANFLILMALLIESKKRKFCSYCLEEDNGFQKLWQVKNIYYCIKHKVKLTSNCPICNQDQPYLHNYLGAYRCLYCENYLFSNAQQIHKSNETKDDQIRVYSDWRHLLNREAEIFPEIINGFNLEQTICITVIYALQSHLEDQSTRYRSNIVTKLLRSEYLSRMVRVINDEDFSQKTTLSHLLKLLDKIKLSIMDFVKIKVPESYIRSIKFQGEIAERCLTPWCITFNKSDAIIQLDKDKSNFNKERYVRPSICTNCMIKFGYKANTKEWTELGDSIVLIDKVVYLLWFSKKSNDIKSILNINDTKYNNAIAYALKHNLLPNEVVELYKDFINSSEGIKECFIKLFSESGHIQNNAKKWYGWNQVQYYYHFHDPEIQYYRWIEFKSKSKRKFIIRQFKEKAEQHIEETSINTLHSENYITTNENTHLLSGDFKSAYEIKRKIKKKKAEDEMLLKVKRYVKYMEESNYIIKCKEVYKYIGKGENTIKSVMPSVAKFVSEQSALSKERANKRKIQNFMEKAENFILEELHEKAKIPLLKEIELHLNIRGKLFHTKYRLVLEHIRQTISTLEKRK